MNKVFRDAIAAYVATLGFAFAGIAHADPVAPGAHRASAGEQSARSAGEGAAEGGAVTSVTRQGPRRNLDDTSPS